MRIHMREKHVLETAHFFKSSPHETTAGRTLLSQFLALYSFYTWSEHVNRKWAFFSFNMPWRYQICMLRVFTLKETICPKICSKSRLKSAKGSLPVDVRRSKTSLLKVLLKIMTENGIYSPPMKVISNTILFAYSLCGALIKIARGYHTRWRNYFDWTNPITGKIRS